MSQSLLFSQLIKNNLSNSCQIARYKIPLLFIAADAGVRKFLIGCAVMGKLLAGILAYISERQT